MVLTEFYQGFFRRVFCTGATPTAQLMENTMLETRGGGGTTLYGRIGMCRRYGRVYRRKIP